MQDGFFIQLLKAISESRLAPYYSKVEDDYEQTKYAKYLWNIALSESLYPALHGLEVALQNSIHNAITEEKGEEDWFKVILAEQEQEALNSVRERLIEQNKSPNVNQLVASSNFGFWVSLFNTRYENILWPRFLKPIFPHMPNRERTRKTLSRRLNRVRELRNRVFHHEPIWHRSHLLQNHADVLETIGWINPTMLSVVKAVDRFPEVYTIGIQGYEKLIENLLKSLENEK